MKEVQTFVRNTITMRTAKMIFSLVGGFWFFGATFSKCICKNAIDFILKVHNETSSGWHKHKLTR